ERVREAPIVPAQRARALRRGNLLGTEPRVALAQLLPAPAGEGLKQLRVLQRQQLDQVSLPAASVIERRPQHRQQPASTQAVDACTWPPRGAPGACHAARLPASVASGRSAIAAPTSRARTRLLSPRSAIVRATRNARCWPRALSSPRSRASRSISCPLSSSRTSRCSIRASMCAFTDTPQSRRRRAWRSRARRTRLRAPAELVSG